MFDFLRNPILEIKPKTIRAYNNTRMNDASCTDFGWTTNSHIVLYCCSGSNVHF